MREQPRAKIIETPSREIESDFPSAYTFSTARENIIVHPSDPDEHQRMALIEASGVLDFWNDPEEDIYTPDDDDEQDL